MCISGWLQTKLGITFCEGQGWGEGGGNRYICISLDVYYYLYSSVFIRYIYGLLYNVTVSSLWPLHQQALVAMVSF